MRATLQWIWRSVLVVLATLVIWGMLRDPLAMHLPQALAPPTPSLPFGADHLGRDLLARVSHGLLWDICIGLGVVVLSAGTGVLLGMGAGYRNGWLDSLLVILMDVLLSLPHIVLAMLIMMYLAYGPQALVLSLVLTGWVKYARIVRAQTYALREQDFIICERVLGVPAWFILARHIFPNVLPSIVGLCALHLGHTLLSIAALGFLGLGLQPPAPEWGTMIMESRPYIMQAPWMAVFPGLFIFVFIFLFTLLGRYLDQRFNAAGGVNAYHH
jgi:ABC-type dipeptide/oligopeptide/nickel transport system permease subunit